jgi:hypothetical protein
LIESATSYDWVEVKPVGADFGLVFPVVGGSVVDDEDEEVPDPPDDELAPVLDDDEPPPDVLPADDPALEAVEPLRALTALCARVATLEATARLGELVEVDAELLPAAAANGLRLLPTTTEWPGVDWTFSAGSVVPDGGGGTGAGVCDGDGVLVELESRSGTATIAASSAAAMGRMCL